LENWRVRRFNDKSVWLVYWEWAWDVKTDELMEQEELDTIDLSIDIADNWDLFSVRMNSIEDWYLNYRIWVTIIMWILWMWDGSRRVYESMEYNERVLLNKIKEEEEIEETFEEGPIDDEEVFSLESTIKDWCFWKIWRWPWMEYAWYRNKYVNVVKYGVEGRTEEGRERREKWGVKERKGGGAFRKYKGKEVWKRGSMRKGAKVLVNRIKWRQDEINYGRYKRGTEELDVMEGDRWEEMRWKIVKREEIKRESGYWNKIRIRIDMKIWREEEGKGIIREGGVRLESGVYTYMVSKREKRVYQSTVQQWHYRAEYEKKKWRGTIMEVTRIKKKVYKKWEWWKKINRKIKTWIMKKLKVSKEGEGENNWKEVIKICKRTPIPKKKWEREKDKWKRRWECVIKMWEIRKKIKKVEEIKRKWEDIVKEIEKVREKEKEEKKKKEEEKKKEKEKEEKEKKNAYKKRKKKGITWFKMFTSIFQKFRFVRFGGIYFEKVMRWQRGIRNARFGRIRRSATRFGEIQWTGKRFEMKGRKGVRIKRSRLRRWEEYYKEHYHYPDREGIVGKWKNENHGVMGNRLGVEDGRDFRGRWNATIRTKRKMEIGKELEIYINSRYTNHRLVEGWFYLIVGIRLWRRVIVHNWITFSMISRDEEFVIKYYSRNLVFWWPFAHWVFCYWVMMILTTDARDSNPDQDDEFYMTTSCAHEWENIVEEVEIELEERDEVNNIVGWSIAPSHIGECVRPDDMDRSKAERLNERVESRENRWGKGNRKDIIKKRMNVIRLSLMRGGKWYEWEWEESDGLYLNDRDVFEDWMRVRDEEIRVYSEEWIEDRGYNRDRQNVEESDEFEQDDNCPRREIQDDLGMNIEWSKGGWRGGVIILMRGKWEKSKKEKSLREDEGMKRKRRNDRRILRYEGDGYRKGKDEERKEKIMEWLRRERREERNKRGIGGRVKVTRRLRREDEIKREARMKGWKKIGKDGNKDWWGVIGEKGEWGDKKKRSERVEDLNIERIVKEWNKKDWWVDTKTLEKISPEYNVYILEKYKKKGRREGKKKERWEIRIIERGIIRNEWMKIGKEGIGEWEERRWWYEWRQGKERRERNSGKRNKWWGKTEEKYEYEGKWSCKIGDNEWMRRILWYGMLMKGKGGGKGRGVRGRRLKRRGKELGEELLGGIGRIWKKKEGKGKKERRKRIRKWKNWEYHENIRKGGRIMREKGWGEEWRVRIKKKIGENWWSERWWKVQEMRRKRVQEVETGGVVKREYHALDRKGRRKTITKVQEKEQGEEGVKFMTRVNEENMNEKIPKWIRFYINIEEKQKAKEERWQMNKEKEKKTKVMEEWGGIKREMKNSKKEVKNEKALRLNEERKKWIEEVRKIEKEIKKKNKWKGKKRAEKEGIEVEWINKIRWGWIMEIGKKK